MGCIDVRRQLRLDHLPILSTRGYVTRSLVIIVVMFGACATPQRFDAVSSAVGAGLTFSNVENARFAWDDGAALNDEIRRSLNREKSHPSNTPWSFLALSGGQEDGAFGAGLLAGWSQHGDRPQFKIVTGTSTGALAAPFAFLGSNYDWVLEKIYTTTDADDVLTKRYLVAAILDDAMMDSTPLYQSIAKYLDAKVVDAIAEEYRKGRLLLISTTNLDSGKLFIWNIGAIAASDNPHRLKLIRRIILASAAVPGLFPPVMIDALIDGDRRQEMHVDGGTVAQVFLYPPSLNFRKLAAAPTTRAKPVAYVIRNGPVSPPPAEVERQTLAIAGRAIETMISSNAIGDLYRIYATTQRDGVGFKLALIGNDFTVPYTDRFDRTYMTTLFQYGRAKAAAGYDWQSMPPGFSK